MSDCVTDWANARTCVGGISIKRDFVKKLNDYFRSTVEIPRIMKGEKQELETLISEEALQFARYLRSEIVSWNPRAVGLSL